MRDTEPHAGRTRLGILISGRGSNFLSIQRAVERGNLPGCEIAIVLSNVGDAAGLEAARQHGLPTRAIEQQGKGSEARAAHDAAMIEALQQAKVDLVCLAGYMRIISPAFVQAFSNRILNVHPSLLPSFPGLNAQAQALHFGVKVTGCTVHFVDEVVDHGIIILQRAVPVLETDTEETLSARILGEEHQTYPEAIARVVSGDYAVQGRRYLRSPR